MTFRFRSQNVGPPPEDTRNLHDVEVLAYMSVEESRIRCEQLPEGCRRPGCELYGVHRDLGLAGYYACAGLHSETRVESLALVYERCDAHPLRRFTDGVQAVFERTVAAADALADVLFALDQPGDGELTYGQQRVAEIHVAHLHALSASASLDRLVTELRAR